MPDPLKHDHSIVFQMADHRDQMMEWVLGRLRSGVDEGEFESLFFLLPCHALWRRSEQDALLWLDSVCPQASISGACNPGQTVERQLVHWLSKSAAALCASHVNVNLLYSVIGREYLTDRL